MEPFLVRLLTAALIIFLVERVLAVLKLRPTADRVVFVVTLIVAMLFAVFGGYATGMFR